MVDTVFLFGTNTFTRHLIDWSRTDCEFWCWNEIGSLKDQRPGYWAKRVDLLIQIHAAPIWRNPDNLNHHADENGNGGHYAWLQEPHEFPIYMQDHYDDVPSSVKYPKEEIVKTLLPNVWRDVAGNVDQVENFTSSTAYALALAIYQGKKRIELAGIELTSDTEYVRQRPGVYFWLGIAAGRGVDVVIHSPLLMAEKLYGYTGEVVIQRQEFEMSARKLDDVIEQAKTIALEEKGRTHALLDAIMKASEPFDSIQRFLDDMGKIKDPQKANARVQELVGELNKSRQITQRTIPAFINSLNRAQDAAFEYGTMTGRYQENARYLQECDQLIEAAGGEKALAALMEGITNVTETV